MAIKYGKGIRGFLGKTPAIDYEYTPIPFREMLAMGQLADRKAQQNMQLQSSINQLYNQPLLKKDQEVYDAKFQQFNNQVGDLIGKSGGSLSSGELTRNLTQQYYDIINDRDYLNAVNAFKQHEKYQTKVMNSVKDPDLRQYYINQSLDQYEQDPAGSMYTPNMNFSTLNETDFDSKLYSVASKLKADKITQLSEDGDLQQTIKTETLTPQEIYNSLVSYMNSNSNMQSYAGDKAAVLGIEYEDFLKGKFQNIANDLAIGNISESKKTQTPLGSTSTTPYTFTGYAFNVPAEEILGFDDDMKVKNFVNNLVTNQEALQSNSPADYSIKRSMLNTIMEKEGLTPEDMEGIISGSSYEDNRPFVEVPSGFGTTRRVRQGQLPPREERPQGRFETGLENLLQNATVIPEIAMYNSKSIKPTQTRAIEALNTSIDYVPSLTVNQIMNKAREWEPAGEQKDYDFSQLTIEGISTRPYFDPSKNESIVKVMGKIGEDNQVFEGDLPVSVLAKVNRDLGAIYDSPTMRDASRLMIEGTSVTGKTFEKATQYLREQDAFKNDNYLQDPNNVFSIVLKENGKFSVVLTDKNTTQVIPGQTGEYTREYGTLTEAAAYIDSLVIASLKTE
tara:strand:- start:15319 stop:17175 length:1857 start_codon:yes stop_codon:yes gene_type:complete